MQKLRRRAIAWQKIFACTLLLASTAGVIATVATADPAPLTLTDVQRLALVAQPALLAEAAGVRALRNQAVAAGQLPDPQLITGIMQMPVNDGEALSLRDDDFTALSVGVAQEFPRAGKRRLRAAALEQQAAASELALAAVERRLKLQAALAYVDVVAASAGARLLDGLVAEGSKQQAATQIAVVAGRESQSNLLAADVAVEVLVDRRSALRQRELAGRAALGRWIGAADTGRPLPADLPWLPDPAPLEFLLDGLSSHPALAGPDVAARVAATQARLSRLDARPDWRLELRYDHRLEFPDLVTVMVGIDLPFFTEHRQDRTSSAARELLTASLAQRDNQAREAAATLTVAYRQWQLGRDRLRRYDDALLPPSRARVQSALAAYQSGQGDLSAVLDARRAQFDAELVRLDLAAAITRDRLQLQYFEAEAGQ
jgi:outer membrane protein TolC